MQTSFPETETQAQVKEEPRYPEQDAALSCPNCSQQLQGPFCHQCGQKAAVHEQLSARHFAEDAVQDLLHFDNKLLRSVVPLLFRPGVLTQAYISGQQKRYVKPLALFFFVNFLFFLIKHEGLFRYSFASINSSDKFSGLIARKMAEAGQSAEIFGARFNEAMQYHQEGYIIVLVPLFALALHLLYIGKKRLVGEHLVFALHFYSFFPAVLMLLPVLMMGVYHVVYRIMGLQIMDGEFMLVGTLLPIFWLYLYKAVRLVYRERQLLSAVKSMLLTLLVFVLIAYVYRTIVVLAVVQSL